MTDPCIQSPAGQALVAADVRPPYPPDADLTRGLADLFDRPVTVLERSACISASTYPSEVVALDLQGVVGQVLCKYSAGRDHRCWGHRGGLEHEARVYQHVLRPLGMTGPDFHGAYVDPQTGWTWLVLEYLDDAVFVHHAEGPEGLVRAAAWLGAFHSAAESCLSVTSRSGLAAYDDEYYRGWIRRTLEYSAPVHDRFPWLPAFCEGAMEVLEKLLDHRPTVIHGEFYVRNVLYSRGRVCPVDWESAAIGAGEIDLASLVEGWLPRIRRACMREYCRARWPEGAPFGFLQTLEAAEVYLLFRWLGDESWYAGLRRAEWRYRRMFRAGRRWGLIPRGQRLSAVVQ